MPGHLLPPKSGEPLLVERGEPAERDLLGIAARGLHQLRPICLKLFGETLECPASWGGFGVDGLGQGVDDLPLGAGGGADLLPPLALCLVVAGTVTLIRLPQQPGQGADRAASQSWVMEDSSKGLRVIDQQIVGQGLAELIVVRLREMQQRALEPRILLSLHLLPFAHGIAQAA